MGRFNILFCFYHNNNDNFLPLHSVVIRSIKMFKCCVVFVYTGWRFVSQKLSNNLCSCVNKKQNNHLKMGLIYYLF